ncbi:ciliogenesis-associated TTC17-interacting protein [Patella vulgata]|uniref:ciliogenesis-associated TTC17-interacting protein n=1 Tax=Patella vulgata TaxID=6465 RepID=UPI0024A874F4|nr:ciliogenesis-associated TTC17-interacting protein [Patella vulgata]
MEEQNVNSEVPKIGVDVNSPDEEKKGDEIPEIPEATSAALKFLESLVPETDFKYMMFDDKLVTISDTGKELGEFCVTIEPTKHCNQDCFLVHANSHGAIDGVPCGTSITCYVTRNLETIEQHHHEYVNLDNCPLDRKTNIVKQETEYTVNRIITQGEAVERKNKTFSFDDMKGFISEGSNLLLHRLLIEKGMPDDDFQLVSFDSETNLCAATYKCLEERTQTVEAIELRVYGIERTINSKTDLPTTWQSYFTQDGHLTNRVQVGSPVGMKLAKVPTAVVRDEEPPKPVFEKRSLNIEEDMQMYSKFLDRKEDIKGDHAVYMRQHPELKALLADFLQFLLLRKPQDVISFASEYFSAFSTTVPNPSPYLASNAPTPFPVSRGNTRIDQLRTPTR